MQGAEWRNRHFYFFKRVNILNSKLKNNNLMKKEKLKKRNTKLDKPEKQYRDLFENMLDGLVLHKLILDKDGNPVDYVLEKANAAAEKILSVKRKDIEDKKATEVYGGDTPFIERYAKVALTGKAKYFIDYYPRHKKWYEIMSFSPEKGYFANIFRDITERKEREEKLNRFSQLLRSTLKINQTIIMERNVHKLIKTVCDILARNSDCYGAWFAILNENGEVTETVESGLGKDFTKMSEMLKKGKFTESIANALKQSNPVINEKPVSTCKDHPLIKNYEKHNARTVTTRLKYGERIYGVLSVTVTQEFVQDKEALSLFQGVAKDVAFSLSNIELEQNKKQGEIALRKIEDLESSTLEAIPHAVLNLQNHRIIFANKGATEVFGWKPEELIGKTTRILYRSDKDYKKFGNNFYSVLKKNQTHKTEFPYKRKDGKDIVCRVSAARIGGKLKNKKIVVVYTDITALKNREKVQSALYKISESGYSTKNLKELCKKIHKEIANLMPADNFYIALYDKDSKMFDFAYWADEREKKPAPIKVQNGITEYIFNTRKPFIANPKLIKKLKNSGTIKIRGIMPVSWIGIPLKNADEIIGVLAISSYTKDVIYAEEDKNILSFVSEQITTAIKQKKMEEEQKTLFKAEREQRLYAETLAKIQLSLASKITLEEVLNEILSQMKMFVPSTTANIVMLEGNNIRILKWVKKIEPLKIKTANNVYPINKFKTNIHILKTKKPLIIYDTKKSPLWIKTDINKNTRSYLGVPIILKDTVQGIVQFASTKPGNFSTEDIKKLEPLTNAATIAIEKASLLEETQIELKQRRKAEEKLIWSYKELQKTLMDMVNASIKIVESRDPYTAIHEKRVARLVSAIAKEMGLTKDEADSIKIVALLHDIGKITIPAEILTKPSKVTKTEFEIIKMHPQVGYEILKDIAFPIPVAKIILQHHERMDGSGYPNGLKGNEIMLEARILAVADVVEAMSSHRPYRPALGIDKALEEIEKNKGILYDSKVVNACMRLFKEKEFKFE